MQDRTEKQVIEIIIEQCTSIDGFLVKLHSVNEFDERLYSELYSALRKYAEIVIEREYVHRAVAGCLLALEQELIIKQKQIYGHLKEKQTIVQQAFEEVSSIILEIIPPTL